MEGFLPVGNRGPALLALSIAFTVASGIFVALRLGIRFHRRLFGWDDAFITFAMIASLCMTIAVGIAVSFGYGKHIEEISDPTAPLRWFYGAQVCYKCSTWPTKLSILLLYKRVFGDTPNVKAYGVRFRTLLWITMFLVIGSFISTSIVGIFACDPIRYSWNKDPAIHGSCVATMPWWFTYAGLNISTDIIILALPIPLLNSLMQITGRQKVILMGVFVVGAFVCIVTIIRMTTLKTGAKAKDPTYFGVETLMWTGVETNLGIMCACFPPLRPILNKLFPWFSRRTSAGTRPSFVSTGSTPTRTNNYQTGGSWSNWRTGQNLILSKVSSGMRGSRGSSEAGIKEDVADEIHDRKSRASKMASRTMIGNGVDRTVNLRPVDLYYEHALRGVRSGQ